MDGFSRRAAVAHVVYSPDVRRPVKVFYWVDKDFGYAISGGSDRDELMRVSKEVYRQLGRR
jgi:anti-sigma factor RsiW